ncbi:MAG TPA: enoyl-CoA hydratase/isomerase family protein [Marmoricola sp.]|nr:enoyl-CoA hydratase/isomerase family protein [Marmoricola sp.]
MSTVVRVEADGGIGRITLNRPEALNAITVDLGAQLLAALRDLGSRADVHVILVRGAGGNFSAGGDFEEVQRLRPGGAATLAPLFDNFTAACRAIGEIVPPVVVAVEGVAMAGGFELLEAADVALVATNARLCDNHINFGQVPGGGGSQRLAPLVGRQRALGHLLSGDRISGSQAAAWGLAYRAIEPDVFDAEVEAFVEKMAGRRPEALATIKRLVRYGEARGLDLGLTEERDAVLEHIAGEAGAAGVTTFRAPRPTESRA